MTHGHDFFNPVRSSPTFSVRPSDRCYGWANRERGVFSVFLPCPVAGVSIETKEEEEEDGKEGEKRWRRSIPDELRRVVYTHTYPYKKKSDQIKKEKKGQITIVTTGSKLNNIQMR